MLTTLLCSAAGWQSVPRNGRLAGNWDGDFRLICVGSRLAFHEMKGSCLSGVSSWEEVINPTLYPGKCRLLLVSYTKILPSFSEQR